MLKSFINSKQVKTHALRKYIIKSVTNFLKYCNYKKITLTNDEQAEIIKQVCNDYSINYTFYSVFLK